MYLVLLPPGVHTALARGLGLELDARKSSKPGHVALENRYFTPQFPPPKLAPLPPALASILSAACTPTTEAAMVVEVAAQMRVAVVKADIYFVDMRSANTPRARSGTARKAPKPA
mmetsp:Transcript_30091/g.54620  ORF Transcript_30091/g.54620 Transcript_30091/m.54620 type:complete len:115 (-) Transcript_30091:184-528(-)